MNDRHYIILTFLVVVCILAVTFFIAWLHWDIRRNVQRNSDRLDHMEQLYRYRP